MKKGLTVLLVFCLLFTMAGCTGETLRKLDAAEDAVEHRLDKVEDSVENAVRDVVTSAPAVTPEAPAPFSEAPVASPEKPAVSPKPETAPEAPPADRITPEQAQQIALDHVGLTADQVQRLRAEFEIDDGVAQYDVEFYEGNWEYEFEIEAVTGKILSYDRDDRRD